MVNKIVAALLMSLVGLANQVEAKDRPNIVWIVSEDNGARWLGAYGNPAKPTPELLSNGQVASWGIPTGQQDVLKWVNICKLM